MASGKLGTRLPLRLGTIEVAGATNPQAFGQAQAYIKGINIVRAGQAQALIELPTICNTTSPTGNVLVVNGTVETILPGCDIIGIPVSSSVSIEVDVWISHEQSGILKQETVFLKRDDLAGTVLASWSTPPFGDGGDSRSGHQWNLGGTYVDTSPSSGHYILSVQAVKGSPEVWSDTRTFCITGLAPLSGATTATGFGQAQAYIKTTKNAFGQTQAYIKAIGTVACGQAQAFISKGAGYGQAQADILATNNAFAQAQAKIRTVNFVYGQTQAHIKALNVNGFGQAAGLITTPFGSGQAQGLIFPEGRPFGQANALVQGVPRKFGMAQALIKHFGYTNAAQAQAKIWLPIVSSQAQAYITSGRTGKNLQGIEERLNPLNQIRWTRDIPLLPTTLQPTATGTQLGFPGYTTIDWEVTNAPDFISAVNNHDDNSSVLTRGNFSVSNQLAANTFTLNPITGFDFTHLGIEGFYIWTKATFAVGPRVQISVKGPDGTYYNLLNRFIQFGTGTFYSFTQKRPWDNVEWQFEDINNLVVTLWTGVSGLPNDNIRVFDVWFTALLKGDRSTDIPASSLPDHAITHGLPGSGHANDEIHIDPTQVIGLNITPGITHGEDVTITAPYRFKRAVIIPRMFVHQVRLNRIQFLPIDRPLNPQEGDMYVDQGDMQPWIYTEDGWRTFAFEGMYGFGQPLNAGGQAQAHIKGFPTRSANARAWIAVVTWARGQAQALIKHVQGTGLAQGNIAYYGNKQGYGQAQALITTTAAPRGAGQARAFIKTPSGALEILFSPTAGQVITNENALAVYWKGNSFIAANILRGFSQAQAYILSPFFTVTWIGPGQAQAYILPKAGYGQAQALIV